MTFTFSIRAALKDSWKTFANHWVFFTVITLIVLMFNFYGKQHSKNPVLMVVVVIASLIWSYVWGSVSLAAVDHKDEILNFKALSVHMPNVRQFLIILAISLLSGIIFVGGLILLVIPGIYFIVRLQFANLAFVDRQQGIKKSLSYSWHLVKGRIFWTALLVMLVEIVLVIVGSVFFFVGALITYPIAMLLVAHLYRALTIHERELQKEAVAA
jgi:uncharacterized membrane protein